MPRLLRHRPLLVILMLAVGLFGCSASQPRRPEADPSRPVAMPRINLEEPSRPGNDGPSLSLPPSLGGNARRPEALPSAGGPRVLLGIDVLEQQNFEAIRGKRVGLLTHAAGVNHRGLSSIEVLRRTTQAKLVALYAVEHGLYSEIGAEKPYADHLDQRTGLMVYSLYNGKSRHPSPAQLAPIDVLVIDLQDIGCRSYTYVSAMRYAMEACFKAGKEVVVLDRPNPLGGLKVDGPPLDPQWTSYVGAFRVPYVHGLTIGELARMAKEAPGVLEVTDAVREQGRLTVIPMRGWKRAMRWPDTGLRWVPTSPLIPDYAAVMGYPMTGLGCYLGYFRHGVGSQYPFRGLSHKLVPVDTLERELNAARIPGLRFRKVSVPGNNGKPATGVFVEIIDWDEWRPTELSLHLMRLACRVEKSNPFANTPQGKLNGFLRHVGSTAFVDALRRDGARTDIESFVRDWQERCRAYQAAARKYWLYY